MKNDGQINRNKWYAINSMRSTILEAKQKKCKITAIKHSNGGFLFISTLLKSIIHFDFFCSNSKGKRKRWSKKLNSIKAFFNSPLFVALFNFQNLNERNRGEHVNEIKINGEFRFYQTKWKGGDGENGEIPNALIQWSVHSGLSMDVIAQTDQT